METMKQTIPDLPVFPLSSFSPLASMNAKTSVCLITTTVSTANKI